MLVEQALVEEGGYEALGQFKRYALSNIGNYQVGTLRALLPMCCLNKQKRGRLIS